MSDLDKASDIWMGVECCWPKKHCEKTACRDLRKSHQLRKKEKGLTNSILFQLLLQLMLNLRWEGAQLAICTAKRQIAHCVMHMPLVARSTYSYTSVQELGKQLDVNTDEEHCVFVVVLLLSAMN